MKDLKKITEEMLSKELVDTLNYNFQKLDEDIREHRAYTKAALDNLSGSIKELRADIKKNDVKLDEILSLIKQK